MKLLLVDDDFDSIESLIDLMKKNPQNEVVHEKDFRKANEKIKSDRPDVVVLDRVEGDLADYIDKGSEVLSFISKEYWKKHFCPVIVYSAMPEEIEDGEGEYNKHPFIHYVKKGSGSEDKVMEKLAEIEPHIGILREVERYVYETFSSVMTEVAPYVFEEYTDAAEQIDVMKRAARRRLAAQMDELSSGSYKLAPWEQYIFPPISEEIRLGNILMKKSDTSDGLDPNAFQLVLTPSCDLETGGGKRERKVKKVLVSQCCPVQKGLQKALAPINILEDKETTKEEKKKKKIEAFLNAGYSNGIIPLPKLEGRIPTMAADLRRLELIPEEDIEKNYKIIASLDSPFREMVSWAYMQIAGRPGLPERDFDAWYKEIRNEL